MIERVQRVALEGDEGGEERKGTVEERVESSNWSYDCLSLSRVLFSFLSLRHTEIKKKQRAKAWISWTASFFPSRCILLAYPRLHFPSIILHPLPVSLSVYRAPLLRLLFIQHTHSLSLFSWDFPAVPFSSWFQTCF